MTLHSFNPKWVVFVEKHGIKSDFYADNLARFGGGFLLNKDLQLDSSLTFNFKDTPSIFNISVVFSGIGEFIDQPLRTYSSGMRARLAFSIASHLSPEILLIDEVLAVGDSAFREKSKNKIMEMVKGEATVVIVSHNAAILREICDRVVCLDRGNISLLSSDVNEVIQRYRDLSEQR